jgi:hypothetical protein
MRLRMKIVVVELEVVVEVVLLVQSFLPNIESIVEDLHPQIPWVRVQIPTLGHTAYFEIKRLKPHIYVRYWKG